MGQIDLSRTMSILQLIMNRWATSNSFQYTVRAQCAVKGAPLDEVRDTVFWVGVGDEGGELTLAEAAMLFRLIEDQSRQLRQLGPEPVHRAKISTKLRNPPTDEDLLWFLEHAEIDEPQNPD